ncbi:MAG: cytochrome P450 [Steroidobacteraceae bacterium]
MSLTTGGAPRGVPVIDIDVTSPVRYGDLRSLEADFDHLREETPIGWVDREPYRPFWAVFRHDDILWIERQHELFINEPRLNLIPRAVEEEAQGLAAGGLAETLKVLWSLLRLSERPVGDCREWLQARRDSRGSGRRERVRTLIDMDEPEHRKFRELTQSWFLGVGVRRLEGRVDAMVQRCLAQMRERGAEVDFARDVAVWFPLSVIMSILDLPESDAPFILRATQQLLSASDPELQKSDQYGVEVVGELFAYFVDIVRHRRRRPGEDLVSVIANARIDGRPLGPVETLSYLLIVTTAGHETTSAALAGGMQALADNPAERARFEPSVEMGRLLADEVVRWSTPVRHFCRTATRDVEIRGVTIRRGESVTLFYPSANRDPQAFEDPYAFRVDRKPNPHLGFGHGVHHCLGRLLALTEIRAFFTALLPQLADVEIVGPVRGIESNFTGGLKSLPLGVAWR